MLIICLFVDDMILFTNNEPMALDVISTLQQKFATNVINDGRNADINRYDILGMEIEYIRGKTMKIGMARGLEDKLPKLNIRLDPYRGVPGRPNERIIKTECSMNEADYKRKVKWQQQVIGLASYVGYKYRFDILYYVNTLARHTLYPSRQVIDLAKQLIQFLWCTRRKCLTWSKNRNDKTKLVAISDAAFANQDGLQSQFGHMIMLNNKIIGARSSKSTITCTSSTEAEIYALAETIPRIMNVETLVRTIDNKKTKCIVWSDSQPGMAAINSADVSKIKSKFYGTKLLRIKEELDAGNIKMSYIKTDDNTADILTKPLSVNKFKELTKQWMQ